jgi:hypothetical protein
MKFNIKWQSVRHNLFLGVTLLGFVAPWVTPRLFSESSGIIQIRYEPLSFQESSEDLRQFSLQAEPDQIWDGQMEILQIAC